MDQERTQHMQMLEHQMMQLQKVLETIDAQLLEINNAVDALQEFSKLSVNDAALVPLANVIYAESKITNVKTLRVNIGSGVVTDKTVDEVIKMMQQQVTDISAYKQEVLQQMNVFTEKLNTI